MIAQKALVIWSYIKIMQSLYWSLLFDHLLNRL